MADGCLPTVGPNHPVNDERPGIYISSDEEDGTYLSTVSSSDGFNNKQCELKRSPALSIQSSCESDAASPRNTTDVYSLISTCPSTDKRTPPMTLIQSVRKTSQDGLLKSRNTPHFASVGLRSCNSMLMDGYVMCSTQRSSSPSYSSLQCNNRYNKWTSSHNSKLTRFRYLFRNTPVDTNRLLVDYSCALSKNSLLHQGRMYITEKWICFYSSVMYKPKIFLSVKEIASITKQKTAHVFPNAIRIIYSRSRERFFFTSFATRDRTFAILHKVWENCRNYETMSIEEIRQQLRELYGEDSVANPDCDEDYTDDGDACQESSMKHADGSASECSDPIPSPIPNRADSDKDLATWSSTEDEDENACVLDDDDDVDGMMFKETDGEDLVRPQDLDQHHDSSTTALQRLTSTHSLGSYPSSPRHAPAIGTDSGNIANEGETRHFPSTDQLSVIGERKQRSQRKPTPKASKSVTENPGRSSPSAHRFPSVESEWEACADLPTMCPSSGHSPPGHVYLDSEVGLNVDALFNSLFTDSNFFHAFSMFRGTHNIEQATWPEIHWPRQQAADTRNGGEARLNCNQQAGVSNTVERTISYTVALKPMLGPRTCVTVEKQTLLLDESRPGCCYVVTTKVTNEAVPLCNYFHVVSYYSLMRTSRLSSRLRVSSQVVYDKSVYVVAKPIIQKNCHSGLSDFFTALVNKLADYIFQFNDDERLSGGWLSQLHCLEPVATGVVVNKHQSEVSTGGGKNYSGEKSGHKASDRKAAHQRHSPVSGAKTNQSANSHKVTSGGSRSGAADSRRFDVTLSASHASQPTSAGHTSADMPRSAAAPAAADKAQVSLVRELVASPCRSISCLFMQPDRAWMLLVLIYMLCSLLLCLFLSMVYNRLVSLEKLADHLSASLPPYTGGNYASRLPSLGIFPDHHQLHVPPGSNDESVQARVRTMSSLVETMTSTVEQVQKTLRDIQELMKLLDTSSGKSASELLVDPLPHPMLSPTQGK